MDTPGAEKHVKNADFDTEKKERKKDESMNENSYMAHKKLPLHVMPVYGA